jgi:hypothetical protein
MAHIICLRTKMKIIKKQDAVEPKVANPSVHTMDVNMAITRNKITK